ncbi:hypothetical protein [Polluticoccus soli]|uniref:hypothetical protein n=1 Tax=Polluticoccus soli TaxID=3034150 RepID=UPI0023E33B7B|nr:hypothetical protein [Flavipsychrobacter sp. JY13-12]
MKRMACFAIMILGCVKLFAQEYRLVYDEQSLPELYNNIYIFAEVKQDGGYRKLNANKYRLQTTEGQLDGNSFTFNRQRLYDNNGVVHFDLVAGSKAVPLTLALPVLQEINTNLYTDSIKPVLNYYLNVEGKFSSGRVFPLDSNFVAVTSDVGSMRGLEWILPKQRDFEKVNFTIVNKFNPDDRKNVTVYLKKYKDPRDAPDYQDRTEDEVIPNRRRR